MANPWDNDPVVGGPASQAGPVYGAPPKPPAPPSPIEQARFGLSQRDQQLQEEAANRQRLEWNATHNPDGSLKPDPNKSDDSRKASLQNANLESIVGQINQVQDLYNKGIRDETLWNAFGLLDGIGPSAAAFDSAGQGVADQGLAAFRVPGVGAQSDLEARQFALANTPQAGNWDQQIEQKLTNVRRRVDANRAALGLPPAQWVGVAGSAPAQQNDQGIPGIAISGGPTTSGPGAPPSPAGGPDGGVQRSTSLNEIPVDVSREGAGVTSGAERRYNDPALSGIQAEYLKRLEAGATTGQLVKFLMDARGGSLPPQTLQTINQQVQYRKAHPNVPIQNYPVDQLDDRFEAVGPVQQLMNSAVDSAPGAAAVSSVNMATGNNLDSIAGLAGMSPEDVRAGISDLQARYPVMSTAGAMTGGTLAALGIEAGLARAGVGGGAGFLSPRALSADAIFGGITGAGSTDYGPDGAPATMGDRTIGAGKGLLAGLAGNVAGTTAGKGLSSLARGTSNPSTRAMQDVGAITTIGQQYGQSGRVGAAVKGVEDRLSGFPIVGDVINARRAEGYAKFNSGAFNKALEPIQAQVGDKVGEEAVSEASDLVQQAFQKALSGKAVVADSAFSRDLTSAMTKAGSITRVGPEVFESIKEVLEPYMAPGVTNISGEAMQEISRSLRLLKAGYKNDPLGHRVGKAIDAAEKAVFGLFERQTPEVMPAYNAAKQAFRRVSILANAVNRAKNQEDKLFTPAQLGMADRQNSVKYDGAIGAARGESQFNDYQAAAQQVLPKDVPDSGTAGRWLLPALAGVGGGVGGGIGYLSGDPASGATTGLTLASILAGAYTKVGQRILTKPGRGMTGRTGRVLQDQRTQRALSAGSAASTAAALTSQ